MQRGGRNRMVGTRPRLKTPQFVPTNDVHHMPPRLQVYFDQDQVSEIALLGLEQPEVGKKSLEQGQKKRMSSAQVAKSLEQGQKEKMSSAQVA